MSRSGFYSELKFGNMFTCKQYCGMPQIAIFCSHRLYTSVVHIDGSLRRFTSTVHICGSLQRFTSVIHFSDTLQWLTSTVRFSGTLSTHRHAIASITPALRSEEPGRGPQTAGAFELCQQKVCASRLIEWSTVVLGKVPNAFLVDF